MSYWDTSTLVKLYVQESDSATFESHALNATTLPSIARITLFEARATFRRKEAEGALQSGAAEKLYAQLVQDVADGEMRVIEPTSDLDYAFGHVLNLCYQQTPPLLLRTLDAMHLASARVAGEIELVTTDLRMRDAAKLLGFTLFPA